MKSIHMNVPGTYQVIPSLPGIISISASLSAKAEIVGRSISDAESKLGCRIVMVENEDDEGLIHILNPSAVDSLQVGDKVLLFLRLDDLKKVEKALGS